MNLNTINEEEVYKILKNRQYLFISTISFEERCTNICQKLIDNNLNPHRSILYDYLTEAEPTDLDSKKRTGKTFMDMAKPGLIKEHCSPNALSTFLEYLLDYGSKKTTDAGEKMIQRVLGEMSGKTLTRSKAMLDKVRDGERDVFC